jgi:hypothetical protein
MRQAIPGGLRRPNHTGNIRVKTLVTGELRYHAKLGSRWLGSFETRREAERALAEARALIPPPLTKEPS